MENPSETSPLPCSLVVDAGYTCSYVIPVFQNEPILGAITRYDVGGHDLTEYLRNLLYETPLETHHLNDIKEKLCYISRDFDADLMVTMQRNQIDNYITRQYVLHPSRSGYIGRPLGSRDPLNPALPTLSLSSERFRVPEALFNATVLGKPPGSLADAIMESVSLCPIELQSVLLSNIVGMGGTFRLPGIVERLRAEIAQRAPPATPVRVYSSLEPNGLAWRGAVDFTNTAGASFVPNYCVSRQEYLESGHEAGRRKFFV